MLSRQTITVVAAILVAAAALVTASYSSQQFLSPSQANTVYEAPLLLADDPLRVYGTYFVKLRESHTFDRHVTRLGVTPNLIFRVPKPGTAGELGDSYVAKKVGDALLAAIRADPGVELVECNRERKIDDVMEKPVPGGSD